MTDIVDRHDILARLDRLERIVSSPAHRATCGSQRSQRAHSHACDCDLGTRLAEQADLIAVLRMEVEART